MENPDGSWIWRQQPVIAFAAACNLDVFRVDFCRFGTPWRKRTRFLVSALPDLAGVKCFCQARCDHVVLRGRAPGGLALTRMAQAYPLGLADLLAVSMCRSCGWYDKRRRLDVAACAKCHTCVGQAKHPGPVSFYSITVCVLLWVLCFTGGGSVGPASPPPQI